MIDKNDEAWTGSMITDRVTRLDTRTGQVRRLPAARTTNIRRVYVDKLDDARDLLGRQQPRRVDREARAAGLVSA